MRITKTMLRVVRAMDRDVRGSMKNIMIRGGDATLARTQLDRIERVAHYLAYRLAR